MQEREITHDLTLTDAQASLLDMHSILNILSVLRGTLMLLGDELGDDEALEPAIEQVLSVCDELADREKALDHARGVETLRTTILTYIDETRTRYPATEGRPEVDDLVDIVVTVFEVLRVRVREILARAEHPERWHRFEISVLEKNLTEFFAAVEKNAQGRYHVVYNIAAQERSDYFVRLDIESPEGKYIDMPPVLQDVFRDLVANARKYTAPGGDIAAGLMDDGSRLRLVVEDSGHGIPESDLDQVVDYGHRAANVGGTKTMGGGFGLTKAYFVTKQFGGRMWIRSEIDRGTRVSIEIPKL